MEKDRDKKKSNRNVLRLLLNFPHLQPSQYSTPKQNFNNSKNNSFNNSFKNPKNSDEKRGVDRFRRVKDEDIEVDPRVKDNSFEAKVSVL